MTLRCRLLGCALGEFRHCVHCGASCDTTEFRNSGPLRRLIDRWYQLLGILVLPRCTQCGKSLLLRRRYKDEFCSDACFSKWLPF